MRYYGFVKRSFKHTREECESKRAYVFVLCVACLTVFVNWCLVKQFAMFGCVCYFVVECDGVVVCGWRCSIG